MKANEIHRRIRELELTVKALQGELYETSTALDRALETKVDLIAVHAAERQQRQALAVDLAKAHATIASMQPPAVEVPPVKRRRR